MPLTPRFTLSQTPTAVTLEVRVPHVRVSQLEMVVDGPAVSLSVRPYLLRLRLPGAVKEEGMRTQYLPDVDGGTLVVVLDKAVPGEGFENLDMISTVLRPAERQRRAPVEDVQGSGAAFENGYGFGRMFPVLFGCRDRDEAGRFLEEYPHLMELKDGGLSMSARQAQRVRDEDASFSPDRVREDSFSKEVLEDDVYVEARRYEPPWGGGGRFGSELFSAATTPVDMQELARRLGRMGTTSFGTQRASSPSFSSSSREFTPEEADELARLRMKTFEDLGDIQEPLGTLLDVLLAYCHEMRMWAGDLNVESGLTVRKLSASLSYSVYFPDAAHVLQAFARRALCYSYLRRWDLICLTVRDVSALLKAGKVSVVRVLLGIRALFARSETLYLLNRLFLDDLTVWVQSVSGPEVLAGRLGKAVDEHMHRWFVVGARSPPSGLLGDGWRVLSTSVKKPSSSGGVEGGPGPGGGDADVFEGLD